MNKQVMKPYSIYLPEEYINRIKEHAKDRKAASLVRDAIITALDGDDNFTAGYNKALRDAAKLVDDCKEIEVIAIRGKYLADILIGQIKELEIKK